MTTPDPSGPVRSRGRTVAIATAVVVPVIGAAGFLVPWLVGLNERSTSADTIEIRGAEATVVAADDAGNESTDTAPSAEPEPDPLADATVFGEILPSWGENLELEKIADWFIPVSAPFETFPIEPEIDPSYPTHVYYRCSPEQLAWLEAYATRDTDPSTLDVQLHNNADTGGAIGITAVRFDGAEVASEPWLRFECPIGGRGGGGDQAVLLGVDGSPAVWSRSMLGEGEPEGSPVTINLSPGELAQVTFALAPEVDRQRMYSGRIVGDLADGSGETVILANDVTFPRAFVPGYYVGYGQWGFETGELFCGRPDPTYDADAADVPPVVVQCSQSEAVALLAEVADVMGAAG